MRFLIVFPLLAVTACTFSPSPPELPERGLLPLPSAVDRAYEDVLSDPTDPAANGELAMVLDRLDDLQHAEVLYRRAYILEPDSFRWIYYRGVVQMSQDKYDPAVAALRHCLTMDPSYLPARLRLIETSFRMGSFAESQQLADEMVHDETGLAEGHYWLGRVEEESGRYADAVEHYRQACQRFPSFGEAHWHWGFSASRLSEQSEAQAHFSVAETHKFERPPLDDPLLSEIRGDEHQTSQILRRAYELEERGQYEEAASGYRRALFLDPRLDAAHARLIPVEIALGNPGKARSHYQHAIRWNEQQADAYAAYGQLLLQERRFQEARASFDKALEVNPFHPEALAHLGNLMDTYEQRDEAERCFRLAIRTRPGYREAHLLLGTLLVDTGRSQEAMTEFEAVRSVEDHRTPALLYQLSAVYVRAGERKQAFDCIRRAHELAREYGQLRLADQIEQESRFF